MAEPRDTIPKTVSPVAAMYARHADLMAARGEHYFGIESPQVLELVPEDARRIIDVGCGVGANLRAIGLQAGRRGVRCRLVGVDIVAPKGDFPGELIRMDAEADEWTAFPDGFFDLVVMNYVLEHVVNPWAFLRKWGRAVPIGGALIVGVPNIAHQRVLRRLILGGDFAYEPSGILDWTHLRCFTRVSLARMLEEAGFVILREASDPALRRHHRFLVRLVPALSRFLYTTHVVLARRVREVGEGDYIPFGERYTL
jgi:SAM-dependent methyltransferase